MKVFCIVILFSNIILFFIAAAVYYYIGQCLHEIGHLIAGRRINPSNPAAIILFIPTLHKHKITCKNTTFYLIPSCKKSKDMSPITCFADNFQYYTPGEIRTIASAGYRNNLYLIIIISTVLLIMKCYIAAACFCLLIIIRVFQMKKFASQIENNDFDIKKNPEKFLKHMSTLKPGDKRTILWCQKVYEEI